MTRKELRKCPCQGCLLRLEATASGDWAHALDRLAQANTRPAKLTAGRPRARLTRRRKPLTTGSLQRQTVEALRRMGRRAC